MAVPLTRIRSPRWTRPALVQGSQCVEVILEAPLDGQQALVLRRDQAAIPLSIVQRDQVGQGLQRVSCPIPEGAPPGMYDLLLQGDDDPPLSPNAVCVMEGDATSFPITILHTSDWHALAPGGNGELADNCDLIRALVGRINEISPDLAICTGDLISRYGVGKEILSPDVIRWQARRVQEIARGLRVPLFVIPGNHDTAFDASRSAWKTYMGGPWERPTEDFSVGYGGCHLAFLDGFAHYDADNALVARGYTPAQIAWLRWDMAQAAACCWRLLFVHYDYGRQLLPLLADLGVDMMFYGHSSDGFAQELAAHHVLNGHLCGHEVYRLVRISENRIASETVPWADLRERPSEKRSMIQPS